MRRTATIGVCVVATFVLINYFEFDYWFFNNEMPAYLRGGVLQGNTEEALLAFYEASVDACDRWRPALIVDCKRYQLATLAHATYVRPTAGVAGLLLTWLSGLIDFMQALKFSIIALAVGGAALCGLLVLPFLSRLEPLPLGAVALAWIGGWIATRPLQMTGPTIPLAISAIGIFAIALWRFHHLPTVKWPGVLQATAMALCFAVGYRIHVHFESNFPLAYLALGLGLWPLLHRALPQLPSGLIVAVLYVSAPLVPSFYDLSLMKQHQAIIVGVVLFVAIWRDEARVFWALPLVLLFDMQNGARLCTLVILAECVLALLRRRAPAGIAPALLTAVVGITVTAATAYYPFDERLYNLWDAVRVLTTPSVVAAGAAAAVVLWTARGSAYDRLLVYAAAVVVAAGLQIATAGLLFDAFQFSTTFRSVAVAPAMAIFFATFALLFMAADKRDALAATAALALLMTAPKGRPIGTAQLSEGLRATFSDYVPAAWSHRTPHLTLADGAIYYSMDNPMTGALMQYSVIKIMLLSRNPEFSRDKLTILPFDSRGR
jgi:hypothetical protein